MGSLALSVTLSASQPLTSLEVEQMFLTEMTNTFTSFRIKERSGNKVASGRIKTAVLNPVVSFTGNLLIETKGDKARLRFDGKTKTNGWFWFTFFLMLVLFFPMLLVLFLMFHSQSKRTVTDLDRVKERMQFTLNDW
jgi:hypothetical protein